MEFVLPTYEIWEQGNTLEDIWAHIARCTRVCYQSEKKDDNETEEEFVKRVILRNEPWNSDANHLAMLEHGTVYLYICPDERDKFIYKYRYENNKYSHVDYYINTMNCIIKDSPLFITTNLRVLIENGWLDDLEFMVSPNEQFARRITVSFTTNIGVTREFNRHRVNSIAEESTRYCNYNKRNDGQLKIGLPAWLLDDDLERLNKINNNNADWLSIIAQIAESSYDGVGELKYDVDYYGAALYFCNICYNKLIERGWKPQQAREVLPLATKSQLIHTAFISDWEHFFRLRADGVSGAPHPNASLLAKPLKEEFIKRGYLSN